MAKPNRQSSRLLRRVLPITTAVVLAIAALAYLGYQRLTQITTEQPGATAPAGLSMTLDRIHQTATRDGRTEWSLDAQSAVYLQDDKKVLLKDLSVTFFLKDGQSAVLTAQQGEVATDSNDMQASGSVVIQNERYRMETEAISYAHDSRQVESHSAVKITGQEGQITADGLTFDLNSNRLTLKGHVQGTLVKADAP
jgi:LPS export ABC transporter protein LptC